MSSSTLAIIIICVLIIGCLGVILMRCLVRVAMNELNDNLRQWKLDEDPRDSKAGETISRTKKK